MKISFENIDAKINQLSENTSNKWFYAQLLNEILLLRKKFSENIYRYKINSYFASFKIFNQETFNHIYFYVLN